MVLGRVGGRSAGSEGVKLSLENGVWEESDLVFVCFLPSNSIFNW